MNEIPENPDSLPKLRKNWGQGPQLRNSLGLKPQPPAAIGGNASLSSIGALAPNEALPPNSSRFLRSEVYETEVFEHSARTTAEFFGAKAPTAVSKAKMWKNPRLKYFCKIGDVSDTNITDFYSPFFWPRQAVGNYGGAETSRQKIFCNSGIHWG